MSKKENTQTEKNTKTETKHLTIANVFEKYAVVGGTKKELATKIIADLKANRQAQTKKGILMEVAVPRQMNAMLSEVGKKGRWKTFKQVGKGDQILLETITTQG